MKRIGLLGGSFNPAHRGHRHISLEALEALGLDEVWWLVSPGNPLKEGAKDMAPFEARFASAEAMAVHAPIEVSDFELEAGTRYTVDTVSGLAFGADAASAATVAPPAALERDSADEP